LIFIKKLLRADPVVHLGLPAAKDLTACTLDVQKKNRLRFLTPDKEKCLTASALRVQKGNRLTGLMLMLLHIKTFKLMFLRESADSFLKSPGFSGGQASAMLSSRAA